MQRKLLLSMFFISLLSLTGCTTTHNQTTNKAVQSSETSVVTAKPQTTQSQKQTDRNRQSNNKVRGFIYHSSNVVIFMKFRNEIGSINGTMYERTEDQNNQLQMYNSAITGTITGIDINLNVTESGNSYTGSLSRNELDLAVPTSDGSVMTDNFKTGTINDFNNYVNQLKNKISGDQQQAAQAQQNQKLTNELNNTEKVVNKIVQDVPNEETALKNDVSKMGKDIKKEQNDLGIVKKDEQKVMSEKPGSQASYDASQVDYDASQIQYDDSQIKYDQQQYQYDLKGLKDDISGLNTDFQKMNQLASQLNAVIPMYLPKQKDLTDLNNASQSTEGSTTKSINDYIFQSKTMVKTANSLAKKAKNYANG